MISTSFECKIGDKKLICICFIIYILLNFLNTMAANYLVNFNNMFLLVQELIHDNVRGVSFTFQVTKWKQES